MGVVASQSSCISCNSVLPFNESEETRLSKSIDRGLRETRRNLAHTPKILLLGSGESGKSTIIKQMRILNNVPFTEYEREVYRVQVFYNLVNGMRSLMDALRDLPPLEPSSSTPNDGNGTNLQDNKLTSVEGAGADGSTTRRPAFQPVPPPSPSPTPPENDNEIGSEEEEGEGDIRSLTSKSDPQSHGTTANNTRLALSSNDHVSPSFRTNNDLDSSGGGAGGGGGGNESGKPPSAPSRSPSVSLNLFQPGSLTPRQLTLLQELNYPPDLRPGQPFPLEFEAILRECWWGITPSQWEAIVVQAKEEARRRAGGVTKQDLEKIHLEIECTVLENGLGDQLDRIERESGVHLPDNLKYLYASPGKLGSYFEEEYVPTDQDILRCRGRTTGIQETVFTLGKKGLGGTLNGSEPPSTTYPPGSGGGGPSVAETLNMAMAVDVGAGAGAGLASTSTSQTQQTSQSQSQSQTQTAQAHVPSTLKLSIGRTRLHFVDVGGQRSERRKWIHCFQDVTGVLFLVGLSGYNQGMIEDSTANQMQDAMSLWDGVCSSQWFKNTALILFLNKTDLFEAKVGKFPINTYFPDYDGDKEDIRAGLEYFRKRFLRIAVKSTRNLRNSDKKSKTGGTRPKAAPSSSSRSKMSGGGRSRTDKGRDREEDDEERSSPTAAAAAAGRKKSRDRLVEESTVGSRKGKGKERERVESSNDQAGQNAQQWSETVTSGTTTNNSYGQTTAVSVSSTSRKGKEREEGERAGVGEMGRIVSGSRSGGGSASTSTRAGGGVAGKSKAKAMESEEERRKRKDSAAAASASAAGGGAGANGGGGSKWRLGAKGGGVDGATKRGRMVYTHFTNATDTLQLRVVILAVCDIILRDNFMNANLI